MQRLKNLEKLLFHHDLKETYSAESLMQNALKRYYRLVANESLRTFFSQQLGESQLHVNQLQDIGELLEVELTGVTCMEMKKLILEARSLNQVMGSQVVSDTEIMHEVQSMGQYQLSAYRRGVQFARAQKQDTVAKKLEQILEDKAIADYHLTTFITAKMNPNTGLQPQKVTAHDGLKYSEGKEDELVGRMQKRLGKTKEETRNILRKI